MATASDAMPTTGCAMTWARPNDSVKRNTADRHALGTSRWISEVPRLHRNTMPSRAITTMPTSGTTNTECQPKAVTRQPHTTGANAGPKLIMHPPMDMNVPSLFLGVTTRMVFIIMGMNMPAPTAWMRRATSRKPKFIEKRPIAEPTTHRTAPAKKSLRSSKQR